MDIRLFLSKIIMLIYRTRQLEMDSYDSLIKISLNSIKVNEKENGFLNEGMTKKMLEYINELMQKVEPINLDSALLSLEVILDNDPKLFKIIERSLSKELTEDETKKVINSLSGEIKMFNKEKELMQVINKLFYETKFNKQNIGNVFDYVREYVNEMDTLTLGGSVDEDPNIVRTIWLNNKDSVKDVFDDVKLLNDPKGIYVTGWQALNRMTQGGLRSQESVGVAALQHNYKTGFTLSLFLQLLLHNTPKRQTDNPGKRPLAVRISLEDSLENNFQFTYQYLQARKGNFIKTKDLENYDNDMMAEFTINELTKTGFDVVMLRVNPNEWTYDDLVKFVLQLESDGYYIEFLFIDYLFMMSTKGCEQGSMGKDKQSLLRKARNFLIARECLFVTPFQLNGEAENLIRNGVGPARFVKEIASKSYYAETRNVSRELDLELNIHLAKSGDKTYLTCGRGKHRGSVLEDESDMFFAIPFIMRGIPLLEDINGADTSFKAMPRAGSSTGSYGNNEGMLDEILG